MSETPAVGEDVDATVAKRIASDPFCSFVGIDLVALEHGAAETVLTVDEDLLNFHGVAHGGAIYALADAAFAAASNADGETALSIETNLSALEAVEAGTRLRATASEVHRSTRTGLYRVAVTTADGEQIATFRGRVYCP